MRRDLIALPENSKVWIYQSNRILSDQETANIQDEIYEFTMSWQSHGTPVDSYGHIFHNLFLVFVADESNHVSGCSIDSSVHFIQSIGNKYNVDFFDRLNYVYFKNDKIYRIFHTDMNTSLNEGEISDETLFFNNLVNTKEAFINNWVSPLKESWLSRYL